MNQKHIFESNPYGPKAGGFDSAALEKFMEVGTKAWADVPDTAAWVRELRGWTKQDLEALEATFRLRESAKKI